MPVDDREKEAVKLFPVGATDPGHLLKILSQHDRSHGWKKPLEVPGPPWAWARRQPAWIRSHMALPTTTLTSTMKLSVSLRALS